MGSEDTIVLRLRAIILVMFGLGITAAVIGSSSVRFFALCFFIPAGWAYVSPRWPAILVWLMWSSSVGLLGLLIALGGEERLFGPPSHWLLAAAAGLLFIALPLVRRMHEAPNYRRGRSRIPEARIHRRDV
jgi:hypothetical protein